MKRRTARLLRHFANKLDPNQLPFVEVVQPGAFNDANFDQAVVTAMRKYVRIHGGRLA